MIETAREFQKNIYSASLTMLKSLILWIIVNCGKFFKRWESPPPKKEREMGIPDNLTCLLRNLYAGQESTIRTRHGTTDWFQIGKGVCQGCILSPIYLTYMQSTSCKMPGWMNHKLESRLPREISITSDMQMTPPLWQNVKRN